MRTLTFAKRNTKEILRDPINLAFMFGFPLVLLLLLSAIQSSVPVPLFDIESLTPGITVFGLAFMTLFSATIIAKDRKSALLQRLYTTPMTAKDFILGYTLPIIPLTLVQATACYIVAIFLGLKITIGMLYALLLILPVSLLYIGIGLLCGSLLNDKQVGGVCGALLTNLSAWLSGVWFDLALVGGAFQKIANALPFIHAVEMEKAALAGNLSAIFVHLLWVLGYAAAALIAAVYFFLRQMKKQ